MEDEALTRALKVASRGYLSTPLEKARDYQMARIQEGFIFQKDPSGNPWQPLSPRTLAHKKTNRILDETGAMKSDLSFEIRITNNQIQITNTKPYAFVHQKGSKNVPQRRFMGFTARDIRAIVVIFEKYARSVISRKK